MKIGVYAPPKQKLTSVTSVLRHVGAALKGSHQVLFWQEVLEDREFEDRAQALAAFLSACDLVIGTARAAELLAIRNRCALSTPFLFFVLGDLPRGGLRVRPVVPHMRGQDRFVVNCRSDVELITMLTDGATTALLPLPTDCRDFFPDDDRTRVALRRRYGFGQNDRVLIYAGRMKLSKNLHTLLRTFKGVHEILPNTHLILAGTFDEKGGLFYEFGVTPRNFRQTMLEYIESLGIPASHIHLAGQQSVSALRDLFSLSDAKINLTLHHDENFGLSQIEAMACGLPVIAASWGGLKDTVEDGRTGFAIGTRMTATGVHVNWCEAVMKTVSLLSRPDMRQEMREQAIHRARRYSLGDFRQRLEEIFRSAFDSKDASTSALQATPFAHRLWTNAQQHRERPLYDPDSQSFELYQKLLGTYSRANDRWLIPDEPLDDRQWVCSVTPIVSSPDTKRLMLDSPFFPFVISVPDECTPGVRATLNLLSECPVVTVGDLRQTLDRANPAPDCLAWMLNIFLLRTPPASNEDFLTKLSHRVSATAFVQWTDDGFRSALRYRGPYGSERRLGQRMLRSLVHSHPNVP